MTNRPGGCPCTNVKLVHLFRLGGFAPFACNAEHSPRFLNLPDIWLCIKLVFSQYRTVHIQAAKKDAGKQSHSTE